MEFRAGFAQRLREALQRQGYNVVRFSELSRYSENRIHKWLAGAVPELPEVMVLAQWLKVSPGWLLFGEPEFPARSRKAVKVLGTLVGIGLLVGSAWSTDPVGAQSLALFPTELKDYVKLRPYYWLCRLLAHHMHRLRVHGGPHRHFRPRLALAA